MEQEKYIFSKVSETVVYEFFSEGPKGTIRKVVRFNIMEESPDRIFNLSFGDSDTSGISIDDEVVSNNADSQKVLNTVAGTVLDFINSHHGTWVFVQGVTSSRTRLYQMGISRYWKEIAHQVMVIGFDKIKKPTFKPAEIPAVDDELAKIIFSPYFTEKDRRANEFLKKHPIPKEFLKKG
jgi:hypothetical protein